MLIIMPFLLIYNHGITSPAWSGCFISFVVLFIIISNEQQNKKAYMFRKIASKRRNRGEKTEMIELAKRFVNKECIIYAFNSQIEGVVKEVSDGAILVENKGTLEAINLDFVTRIREYPKKKNGKKKSVVLD